MSRTTDRLTDRPVELSPVESECECNKSWVRVFNIKQFSSQHKIYPELIRYNSLNNPANIRRKHLMN